MQEIEKKYLVEYVSDQTFFCCHMATKTIQQGYIAVEENGKEIRIRKIRSEHGCDDSTSYCLTVKSGQGLAREETEMEISPEQFEVLWPLTFHRRIEKNRLVIALENGLLAEVDFYFGNLAGLYTAEVEFPDIETAEAFTPPDWFGADVTKDKRFKNQNLAALKSVEELWSEPAT
ncbi:MAG TPA: CYTH domain-containing protein [bacterium]|mgnify:CR=1 FL=1|nr:CYTH domain-containing protein [bacterium]HNZ73432.1 CYTH domain-containing protein [bacterium]HOH66874.1 CYTH domain-containing protein [bacterium]HPN81317.1 CYTH domain-containing protein [bacterium]HPW39562.1 CYTH domain-containing protein [bacterium]